MKKLLILTGLLIFTLPLKAQEARPQDFTGVYRFQSAPFDKIVITFEDGVLMADAEGIGKGEIKFTGIKDEFSEPSRQAILKFRRDASGRVARLVVDAGAGNFEGVKTPASLEEYAGKYSMEGSAEVAEVTVTVQNGSLHIEAPIGSSGLIATDLQDAFQLAQTGGGVVFKRSESGKVKGIEVEYSGATYKGTRKE